MKRHRAVRTGLLTAVVLALAFGRAAASDPEGFKIAKSEYEKISRRHDDQGARDRRDMTYGMSEYLDQKACRKFLAKSFDKEKSERVACAIVDVLGACGVPDDLDDLFGTLGRIAAKKSDPRCTVIALARGLAATPPALAETATAAALEALPKSKGDLRLSLLTGIGAMGSSTATTGVRALSTSDSFERFERDVALGACGRDAAVPDLVLELAAPDPLARLGAAMGLAKSNSDEAMLHLIKLLDADDPRLVEIAAQAVGAAKLESSAEALIAAFEGSPLRTRNEVRLALANIAGKDLGLDPAAWKAWLAAKKEGAADPGKAVPVKLPKFFGTDVPSDRVIVLLDLSGSMDWKGRITKATDGLAQYLESLPDSAEFSVYGVSRSLTQFSESPAPGTKRREAATWVRKQLTGRAYDLNLALTTALDENPNADTIVLATDSGPTGSFKTITYDESTAETLALFERANRTRRIRVFAAFTVPGGRDEASEAEVGEYEDRIVQLRRLTQDSGGSLEIIDN